MPFSKENIRFTVLAIGFTLLCMTAVIVVAAISKSGGSIQTTATIISFIGLQAGQLLLMLRGEQTNREVVKTRHDLKQPLQAIVLQNEEKLPCTREELKAFMKEELRPLIQTTIQEVLSEGSKGASATDSATQSSSGGSSSQ